MSSPKTNAESASKKSQSFSTLPAFSTIYIEHAVADHPRTQDILKKWPHRTHHYLENHKRLTQPHNQNFREQKIAPSLILAERRAPFLYPCSDIAPSFGQHHFYYATPAINCLYDCEYCYLQGMYNSANIIVYINQEDFLGAVDHKLAEEPLYLCLSYDSDLLAMESLFPLNRFWIEASRTRPDALFELRSKSANFRALKDLEPSDNVILAWTVSPESVIRDFEAKTANLQGRVNAMKSAQERGWSIRICIDPILQIPEWEAEYRSLLEVLKQELDPDFIRDIALGFFRLGPQYLSKMRKILPHSPLVHHPNLTRHDIKPWYSYPTSWEHKAQTLFNNQLASWVPKERLVWT